jgi:dTDP-4-dehydrorhamnose reductase
MEKKKILITGASGIIGEACYRIIKAEAEHELFLVSSGAANFNNIEDAVIFELSALDKQGLKKICLDIRPEVIINAISMSDLAICEKEKRLAWELNAYVVENLARVSKIIESHLITFSSDQVFDGRKGPYLEKDLPGPVNYYGKSKHAAENFCLSGGSKFTIIRHSEVYGKSYHNKCDLACRILRKLDEGERVGLSNVNYFNPVYSDDIAIAVLKVMQKKRYGIYNAAGADYLSYFEFGKYIAEIYGYNPNNVFPVPSQVYSPEVFLPEKAGLINLKSETDLNIKFSGVESGLLSLKYKNEKSSKFGI